MSTYSDSSEPPRAKGSNWWRFPKGIADRIPLAILKLGQIPCSISQSGGWGKRISVKVGWGVRDVGGIEPSSSPTVYRGLQFLAFPINQPTLPISAYCYMICRKTQQKKSALQISPEADKHCHPTGDYFCKAYGKVDSIYFYNIIDPLIIKIKYFIYNNYFIRLLKLCKWRFIN